MSGILYLVPTPIGNLGDISHRCAETLAAADFIAAEDTRVSLKLLNHLDIKKPLVSYHEHNKKESGSRILERLLTGETCALVTDAGCPAISDPGEDLVRLCAEAGVSVCAIPGPCAAITALSVSALATGRFAFEGFLPFSKKERRERLERIAFEAAKQCRRGRAPEIAEPMTWKQAIARMAGHDLILVPWEDASGRRLKDAFAERPDAGDIGIVIGPEGGMSEGEVGALAHIGALTVTLGPRILRTETAAVVSAALAMQLWGDL